MMHILEHERELTQSKSHQDFHLSLIIYKVQSKNHLLIKMKIELTNQI